MMRRRYTSRQTRWTLALCASMLLAAMLACTSNDSLFIRLTETPVPSATPTPLALDTKFRIGDTPTLVSVSEFTAVLLPPQAGPFQPGSPGTSTCFPNSSVKVLDVSRNVNDPSDPMLYYQIQCTGVGWVPEFQLARYKRADSAAVAASEGAALYSVPDASTTPTGTCKSGAAVRVLKSINNTFDPTDQRIYVEVSCGVLSGYVLEDTLQPAAPKP